MLEKDYIHYKNNADPSAPCVYFVNMHAYPMDISSIVSSLKLNAVSFFVTNWDDDLSPWKAPGLYQGDPDFKGYAENTLNTLEHELIPRVEKVCGLSPASRGIAGYSMGGLFSTYAFLHDTFFKGMASMSGSLWFPDWPEYLSKMIDKDKRSNEFENRFAYFSIGSQEKRAQPSILHCVEERNINTAMGLKSAGAETEFEVGPGNHFQHMEERCAKGLNALQNFFLAQSSF